MASAAAAGASQRAPAVVSGHGQGAPVSEGSSSTTTTTDTSSSAAPPSVGSPARRTTLPALADSTSAGNPQRPVLLPDRGVAQGNEGRQQVVVLAVLGYNVTVLIGIIPELGRIVSDFSAAAQVAYGVTAMLAAVLLPVSFMSDIINHSSASAFCAELGAIACSDLLVVAISTRFGRWGRLAAAPLAAAVTCIMAALWKNGAVVSAASWSRRGRMVETAPDIAVAVEDAYAGPHEPVSNDYSPTAPCAADDR